MRHSTESVIVVFFSTFFSFSHPLKQRRTPSCSLTFHFISPSPSRPCSMKRRGCRVFALFTGALNLAGWLSLQPDCLFLETLSFQDFEEKKKKKRSFITEADVAAESELMPKERVMQFVLAVTKSSMRDKRGDVLTLAHVFMNKLTHKWVAGFFCLKHRIA